MFSIQFFPGSEKVEPKRKSYTLSLLKKEVGVGVKIEGTELCSVLRKRNHIKDTVLFSYSWDIHRIYANMGLKLSDLIFL